MERLDSLSLLTQQISVKGGMRAPGCFYFKPQCPSRGHLALCTGPPPSPLGSVPYLLFFRALDI